MCVYCHHVIITFCYNVKKIQEEKLVIVLAFNWLSRHIVYYFMYEWVWLYASIINTEPMSLVYSLSLKFFYKINEKLIDNNNGIKIKMLDKLNKIKWS